MLMLIVWKVILKYVMFLKKMEIINHDKNVKSLASATPSLDLTLLLCIWLWIKEQN